MFKYKSTCQEVLNNSVCSTPSKQKVSFTEISSILRFLTFFRKKNTLNVSSFFRYFSMRQGILPIFFLLFCLHFKFSTQNSLFAEPSFLKSTLLDTPTPSATIPTSNEYKAYLTLKTVRINTFYQLSRNK